MCKYGFYVLKWIKCIRVVKYKTKNSMWANVKIRNVLGFGKNLFSKSIILLNL